MGIIKKARKGYAVYWPVSGTTGRSGRLKFGAPVEIRVRWDDTVVDFIDSEGKEAKSQAMVMVDRKTPPGGFLYKGKEETLESNHSDPYSVEGAYRIRRLDEIPNFKHTDTLRIAYL
jgi:hypothetical protein